tara:strand:+ start:1403 stop:1531 length:129 start_codon:yes stop_codon:yes gene_type:complete
MNQLPNIRKRIKKKMRLHEAQILAAVRVDYRQVKKPTESKIK